MTYRYLERKRTLGRNEIFNSLHLKNVTLVKEMDLNLAIILTDVLIAEEMAEFDPIKVFLQFNKPAHNVRVVERK